MFGLDFIIGMHLNYLIQCLSLPDFFFWHLNYSFGVIFIIYRVLSRINPNILLRHRIGPIATLY